MVRQGDCAVRHRSQSLGAIPFVAEHLGYGVWLGPLQPPVEHDCLRAKTDISKRNWPGLQA